MSTPSVTGVPKSGTTRFISGVVEGFYGRPWTMEQRRQLFKREQRWGLNAYLYAPKDDSKHRMNWRDLYSAEEAEQLKVLISAAKEHEVEFIYAISPGLDITFSNPREVATLKRKLDQVHDFGCRSFSLLFDDLESQMCPADMQAFKSFAHAQVAITNQVFQHLGEPQTFLFCPTAYCAAFCTPNVAQSTYLDTVGDTLLPGIDVLWTGPKVVSHIISVESIDEVTSVLKRAPVIWDNIHANDYDPQRLFLGPFKDRPTELIPKLKGILTNPNCEFNPNFVAIHTLATWCKSNGNPGQRDVDMSDEDLDHGYSPQKALSLALTDWLQEFLNTDKLGGFCSPPTHQTEGSLDEEPMQLDVSLCAPGPRDNPLYTAEPLTLEDLNLLSELFYLPYEHGPTAKTMLQELDWLKNWSRVSFLTMTDQTAEWRSRALHFDQMCEAVVQMFNRLSNAPNRSILYDLYKYICDIKRRLDPLTVVKNDDPEPWGFRGGLSGEFQRMLPCHGNRDLFRNRLMTPVYTVRPYCPWDKMEVQRIFNAMQRVAVGKATSTVQLLMSDCLADGQLPPSSQCAFVLEDEMGLCGYALGLTDVGQTTAMCQRALWDSVLRVYPSLITMQLLPRLISPDPAKHMIGCLLSAIKSSGSSGAFCELRPADHRMRDFYTKLGSFKTIPLAAGLQKAVITMGTSM
ncbi:hypothetical protein NHX12_017794 [Muraenolepis orangiensis]|uniref:protein O-GlcNAcase n=1 Tax=Muraenolepis orangiensis TaxID=630683 RepID=A0A9Q0EVK4_9TELE|nr:hypothetical protein NHX12_017794 [Muraenolepis orangiensis]